MNKTIFFNISLPRAGSTLLQNIIAQNPQFYSTPSSGMSELIFSTHKGFFNSFDFKREKDYKLIKDSFYKFCRGGINDFYQNITQKPYILDKNRLWLEQYYFLKKLYPNFKMVCMVRDLRSIVSSLEKMYRNDIDAPFRLKEGSDYRNFKLEHRVSSFLNEVPLTPTIITLKDFIQTNNLNNIHFIRFEDLCFQPQLTLKNLYNFLEVPNYPSHNFNKIKQTTWENDNIVSYGSHSISPSLHMPNPDYNEILGKDTSDKIYTHFEWYFKFFNYTK